MTTLRTSKITSTTPTVGGPIGPNRSVTTSTDVDAVLSDSEVTFDGYAPKETTARWVHWLAQASPYEALVAAQHHPSGARLASIYLIERTDDQGRTWSCVTSSCWTAGLFLSNSEAQDFAVEVAKRETPSGGWDYSFCRDIPARSHIPPK